MSKLLERMKSSGNGVKISKEEFEKIKKDRKEKNEINRKTDK